MSTIRNRVRRLEQLTVPPPAQQSTWSAQEVKLIESDPAALAFVRRAEQVMLDAYAAQPELKKFEDDREEFLRTISTPMLELLREALVNLHARLDVLRGGRAEHLSTNERRKRP